MLRCWFLDFDVEAGRRPDFLDPGIAAQSTDAVDNGLVEAFRLDLHTVTDASRVNEADAARADRHEQRV